MIRSSYFAVCTALVAGISLAGCSDSQTGGQSPDQGQSSSQAAAKAAFTPMSKQAFDVALPDDVYPESRSRIPLVDRGSLSPERQAGYDRRAAPDSTSLGGLQGPGGLRLNATDANLDRDSPVSKRTRELVRLVVSKEMDQGFEWTVHEPVALKHGLEPEIIDVIRYDQPLDGVPEFEASIIQLGREVFRTTDVSQETFARVHEQLGTHKLIDLCDFMGDYTRTAILLHTVDVHLPYDLEPLLPNRRSEAWPMSQEEYEAWLPEDVYPDSRSRIPMVDPSTLGPFKRARYYRYLSPENTTLAGLQGPGGLRLNSTGDNLDDESPVSKRIRELVRLVISQEWNQVFEWTVHEPVALKHGLEPEIIDVIRYARPLDNVPELEASIIQLGREVMRTRDVSPETFARAHEQLGTHKLIDVCDFMGNYSRTAILLHTFDVHLPYDTEPLLPASSG